MKKNEYTMYSKNTFTKIYNQMSSEKDLLATMVEMQTKRGINEQKAYENACEMMGEVSKFECTKSMLMEDPDAVIDDFLLTARNLQGYDRKLLLHEISFGLSLYQSPELMEKIKEGATTDELFRSYYEAHGEDPEITCEVLENDIRKRMTQFRVSPGVLRTMAKKLEKSKDVLFTSEALGKDNLRLKCVLAMELYLRDQDNVTIADAVNIACTDMEVEAVADAVSRGQMAAQTAGKIFAVLCLTAIVFGALTMLSTGVVTSALGSVLGNPTWSALNSTFGFASLTNGMTFMEMGVGSGAVLLKEKMMQTGFSLLFGGIGFGFVFEHLANLFGRLTAKLDFLYADHNQSVSDGLDSIANYIEAEEYQPDSAEACSVEEVGEEAVLEASEGIVF